MLDYSIANKGFAQSDTTEEKAEEPKLRLACMKPIESSYSGTHEQELIFYGKMSDILVPSAPENAAMRYIHANNLIGFSITDVSRPVSITSQEWDGAIELGFNPGELAKVKVLIRSSSV